MNNRSIEREYHCPKCDLNFDIMHKNKTNRNTECMHCGSKIYETGRTLELEGKFVIIKQNGKEVDRYTDKRGIGNKL